MPVYSRAAAASRRSTCVRCVRGTDGVVRQIVGDSLPPPGIIPYIIPTGFMQLARTHARVRVGLTQGGSAYVADDGALRNVPRRDGASHRVLHCSDIGLLLMYRTT